MSQDTVDAPSPANYNDIGIVFIGPIIGLPKSLMATFDFLKHKGVEIEGVDIWEDQEKKKNLFNILGLTILPGSHKKRVAFANNYKEHILFENIINKIEKLKKEGRHNIILGGMSGGFVFASRLAQMPLDNDLIKHKDKIQPFIKGLFGVSPIVFYPEEVTQKGANLELIPSHIPTTLIWGDADHIIPKETITHSQKISQKNGNIKNIVINGEDVGHKNGSIRHQFFGGEDFIKPLKNVFWNKKAEDKAIGHIHDFIKKIHLKNKKNNA